MAPGVVRSNKYNVRLRRVFVALQACRFGTVHAVQFLQQANFVFLCVLQAGRASCLVAAGAPVQQQQRATVSASACGAGMSWRKQSKSRWEGQSGCGGIGGWLREAGLAHAHSSMHCSRSGALQGGLNVLC
jgi:hypothetical protein